MSFFFFFAKTHSVQDLPNQGLNLDHSSENAESQPRGYQETPNNVTLTTTA